MANGVDIRGQYTFVTFTRNGMTYKQASGWLGMPDQVSTYRSSSEQKKVAGGTGDDAGHLIGNRFGAPGGAVNLSLQNWRANRCGSYKDLENAWAAKRKDGIDIYVQVTDISRPGEQRPFRRNVQWKERVNGVESPRLELDFANAHTAESRLAQHIPPTDTGGQDAKIIPVDFVLRRRLD
jgi:hypothetical protein